MGTKIMQELILQGTYVRKALSPSRWKMKNMEGWSIYPSDGISIGNFRGMKGKCNEHKGSKL
jgi:hypothetical protein